MNLRASKDTRRLSAFEHKLRTYVHIFSLAREKWYVAMSRSACARHIGRLNLAHQGRQVELFHKRTTACCCNDVWPHHLLSGINPVYGAKGSLLCSCPGFLRCVTPLHLLFYPTQTDGTAPQPAPDSIGKDLEHQLLFGEHGSPSHSHSAPTTAAAPADGAASRIQAGFILVKLYDSNSSYPLHQGSTEATTAAPAESALLAHGDSSIAGGTSAVLEGAVKAQHTTGAPLMLAFSHFVRWPRVKATLEMIAEQQRDTADAGTCASGSRPVIVAGMHGGVSQSLPDQAALLSNTKGVVLCFDCFGRVEWSPGSDYYPSDEESAVRIAELVRRGFAERIVISSGVSRRIHLSRLAVCCAEREKKTLLFDLSLGHLTRPTGFSGRTLKLAYVSTCKLLLPRCTRVEIYAFTPVLW